MSFTKYIAQFAKNTASEQTHLSLNNGKYNVPENEFDNFYKRYYNVISNKDDEEKESLYLVEKVSNSVFAFFVDLDIPKRSQYNLTDEDILELIAIAQTTINELFVENANLLEYVVSKRTTIKGSHYHINFYNLIVNNAIAKRISTDILQKENLSEKLKNCIDVSVYRTGLRMLGSKKSDRSKNVDVEKDVNGEDTVYKLYDIVSGTFIELYEMNYQQFAKTIVKRIRSTELSQLKDSTLSKNLYKTSYQLKKLITNV